MQTLCLNSSPTQSCENLFVPFRYHSKTQVPFMQRGKNLPAPQRSTARLQQLLQTAMNQAIKFRAF